MFEYMICNQADKEIFTKQCESLEKNIPHIQKKSLVTDVDNSETQCYTVNDKNISVHNSFYLDSVYVQSEIDLSVYFDCKTN